MGLLEKSLKQDFFLGGNKMRYVPHIHNGFVNILYKVSSKVIGR